MLTVEHSRQERVLLAMLEDCWREPGVREDHKGIVLDWCLEQGREDWHRGLLWAQQTRRWPMEKAPTQTWEWYLAFKLLDDVEFWREDIFKSPTKWFHWVPEELWHGRALPMPERVGRVRFGSAAEALLRLAQHAGGWLEKFPAAQALVPL